MTTLLIALNVAVYGFVTLPLSARGPDPADPLLAPYLELLARALGGDFPPSQLSAHVSAYDLVVFRYGFRPSEPSIVTLFTSMFLHAGALHLIGNMLFLWIYGNNVEHRLGRAAYCGAYLATGVAATLSHSALLAGSEIPSVGASGAISGVLGFYFVFFPRNRVRVFLALLPIIVRVVEIPARIVLGLYLLVDNVLPLVLAARMEESGVAHGAHIGGFVAGLGAAWLVERLGPLARPSDYREVELPPSEQREPRTAAATAAATATVERALEVGDVARAAQRYFADPARMQRALPVHTLLALADGLAATGHAEAAVKVYLAVVQRTPHGLGAARAHERIGELLAVELAQSPTGFQHLLDAVRLDPDGPEGARSRAVLDRIAAAHRPPLDDRRWRGRG